MVETELESKNQYHDFIKKCIASKYEEIRSTLLQTNVFKNNENELTQDLILHIKNEVSFDFDPCFNCNRLIESYRR